MIQTRPLLWAALFSSRLSAKRVEVFDPCYQQELELTAETLQIREDALLMKPSNPQRGMNIVALPTLPRSGTMGSHFLALLRLGTPPFLLFDQTNSLE